MLVGCVSFAGDPIGCVSCLRTHLLWLPPRVAFFSHIGDAHCYYSSMSSPSYTTPLSPQKAIPVPTTELALSLLRRSLARSVCSDVHVGLPRSLPPAARAPRIALNFSPHKSGVAARRPAACATEKWASRRRPRCPPRCCRGRDATSDPPPRGRARLVESPRQGGN
jgi:hypothetical protein